MSVKPIPDGYHSVTPYLVVAGAAGLIEFIKRVFDATETERIPAPSGLVAHAEARIGNSLVMISDARAEHNPMPAMLYVYVPDADAAYRRAIEAGATSVMAPADQFYGDRNAGVADRWGNHWWIATHVEDVAPDELEKRAATAMKG